MHSHSELGDYRLSAQNYGKGPCPKAGAARHHLQPHWEFWRGWNSAACRHFPAHFLPEIITCPDDYEISRANNWANDPSTCPSSQNSYRGRDGTEYRKAVWMPCFTQGPITDPLLQLAEIVLTHETFWLADDKWTALYGNVHLRQGCWQALLWPLSLPLTSWDSSAHPRKMRMRVTPTSFCGGAQSTLHFFRRKQTRQ